MNKLGWGWQIKFSGIALTILSFLLLIIEIPLLAKSAIAREEKKSDSLVIFQPPPEDAKPESAEGAASRNGNRCPGDLLAKSDRNSSVLKAIVPQGNFGLTTQKHPTFWAYIPPTTAQSAILSIAKVGEKPHWHQAISLTGESGTIGVKLDSTTPGLKIGQNYLWTLILICNAHPHPNDPVVTAGVKRIPSNLPQNIAELERATWYAKRGIWYDALDILAKEKSVLNNGEVLWSRYLRSGGFEINTFKNEN